MDHKPPPHPPSRRIVLTMPGETFEALQEQARREMRPTKAEAVKLLVDALRRESKA